jgi:alpha-methylacyl-CoA racemase
MCSLLLAQAGAEVIKVERPGRGDEMRSYEPKFGDGQRELRAAEPGQAFGGLDLKDPAEGAAGHSAGAHGRRPGRTVPSRRDGPPGAGLRSHARDQPGLVYCAITGWGQHGPLADMAAHDLNYQAETGLLA